ncbi:MAG: hypothetical protein ACXVE8_06315 [Solirubrobacteraceae bacterium]
MFSLIAAAGLIVAASLLVGCAGAVLCESPARAVVAPATGLAALLVLTSVAIRLPGRAVTAAGCDALLVMASAAYLLRRRPGRPPGWAAVAGLGAALAALVPFPASGRVGLLGAGTNDDMAEHLLAAWTLQGHVTAAPAKLLSAGYPVGPHAIAATIAQVTGISLERTFTGEIIAVPVLLALTAAALMPRANHLLRGAAGAAVGVCYLQAAFLAQSSFKEPMEALLLIGFAGGLHAQYGRRTAGRAGEAIPLGVTAAGAVYVYSYAGVVWLAGTLVLVAAWSVLARRRAGPRRRAPSIATARVAAAAGVAFLVLVAPETSRMLAFARSGYNQEGSNVLGNLLRPLPALEATGIWPSADFRFNVPLASASGILALIASGALAFTLWRCLRRGEPALPAATVIAIAMWGWTSLRSPYTASKSLALVAPLITLLLAREALLLMRVSSARHRSRALAAGFGALLAVGAYSDLKVLRDAPVAPSAHASELARLRPALGRQPALFLGADDYVQWELRGARVTTPPAPLYTKAVVPLARTKARQDDPRLYRGARGDITFNRFAGLGLAFDFDSVPSRWLDRFRFVIAPRSAYASVPPSNWHLVARTRSYELYRRQGPTAPRLTLTEVDNPGAILDCRTKAGRAIARTPGVAMTRPAPIIGDRWWWKGRVGYAGTSTEMTLRLPRGRWGISLQYDSVAPATVHARGLNAALPANLEPLGPYWYVGSLAVRRARRVAFVLRYRRLPLLGRLLGSSGQTRAPTPTGLTPRGRLTATRLPVRDRPVALHDACGRYVDFYRLSSTSRGGASR